MEVFQIHRHVIHLTILFLMVCLMSCTPGDTVVAGGGIGGTGVISTGTVTEIGSISVNGIEYDTQNASVYINDVLTGNGDQTVINHLSSGQVVRVTGSLHQNNTGEAEDVFYFSTLIGPIQAIDIVDTHNRIFHVLGQQIVVTDQTVIDQGIMDDFYVGNLMEASGLFDETDKIRASYIRKIADTVQPDDRFRVTGQVRLLDENITTFFINALEINYDTAELAGVLQEGLENDIWVHISGIFENGNLFFTAEEIRPFQRVGEDDGKEIEIEGIAGCALSENKFNLEDIIIEVTTGTKFIGGSIDEILAGTRLEVEGLFVNDILIAERLKFKTSFKVASELAEKNDIDQTLALTGIENLMTATNNLTRFNGTKKTFDELATGDYLTIKGWITHDQILMATQITTNSSSNGKVILRGALTAVNTPYLTINTTVIDTDTLPSDGFFAADASPVTQESFLNLVEEGDVVDARGQLNLEDSVAWSSITFIEK